MKKNYVWGGLIGCLLGLSACTSDIPTTDEGQGVLCLNVQTKTAFTRAIDEEEYKNTDQYVVDVYRGKELVFSEMFKNMALAKPMEAGSYTVKAHYGTNRPVALDGMYVEGVDSFEIVTGQQTDVTVKCVPANVKVKVVRTRDFDTYFSDFAIHLLTPYMEAPFVYAKTDVDAGKEVYVKSDAKDGVELAMDIRLTAANEQVAVGDSVKTVRRKVYPRDCLTITLNPQVTEVHGGKISGIRVSVDDGVKDEHIDITIPSDYL